MAKREIHLELLLSKRVTDQEGKPVGRIEEVRAKEQDGEWVVEEYHVGPAALLERLSASGIGGRFLRMAGVRDHPGYRVPWDKLDLSDPDKPKLLCEVSELKALS